MAVGGNMTKIKTEPTNTIETIYMGEFVRVSLTNCKLTSVRADDNATTSDDMLLTYQGWLLETTDTHIFLGHNPNSIHMCIPIKGAVIEFAEEELVQEEPSELEKLLNAVDADKDTKYN